MEVRNAANPRDVKTYDTARLREEFHITGLFQADQLKLVYSHFDRIITGGAMPVKKAVKIECSTEIAASYFLERREMGILNLGGEGTVTVDGVAYDLAHRDCLYIGMGSREIEATSKDPKNPAKIYMSSCPAHKTYPTKKVARSDTRTFCFGTVEKSSKRTVNQYVHPEVVESCQLQMGITEQEPGCAWCSLPCHTHDRRMEVYMYFNIPENEAVFHFMGEPNETRHLVIRNEEGVIVPSWSIHTGVGTDGYAFVWSMCGENQSYDDMDNIDMNDIF